METDKQNCGERYSPVVKERAEGSLNEIIHLNINNVCLNLRKSCEYIKQKTGVHENCPLALSHTVRAKKKKENNVSAI